MADIVGITDASHSGLKQSYSTFVGIFSGELHFLFSIRFHSEIKMAVLEALFFNNAEREDATM